jgi:polysaccharide pyruvyl transferase WcaK-like protein
MVNAAQAHPPGPVILVTDGWLANSGDTAIYIATTRSLQRLLPGARVAIAAHHRELVGGLYPELDLVPPLDSVAGVRWLWTTEADLSERDAIERVVDEADVVLAAGGGYLLERYGPENRIRGYEEVLARGKRLMFDAQSIGEFLDRDLGDRLQSVLEAAELVIVRDEPSLEVVRDQREAENVHLTADEAFLFSSPHRPARPRSLLVTVSAHAWERRGGENELDERSHLPAMAAAINRLLESGAAEEVTLASTTQGLGGPDWALEDDAMEAQEVYAAIPPRWQDRVNMVSGYLRPDQYAAIAARHAAALSMRMHGGILAAVAGTPVLIANASDKARALSERTSGGIRGIANRGDLDRLDEFLVPMLDQPREVLIGQNRAVEQMQAHASRNARLIAEALR